MLSSPLPGPPPAPDHAWLDQAGRARAYLNDALAHDRDGRLADAIKSYHLAIGQAEREPDDPTLSEALRLLAIAHFRQNQGEIARALCRRSHQVAEAASRPLLAAQALNTLAACDLSEGAIEAAREAFLAALAAGSTDPQLRGRIEQNLGIIANIQGDLPAASGHYERALGAFEEASDERGCAMVYNSLGMISADQKRWAEADEYCRRCLELTTRLGDVRLRGMALITQTEVHIPCGRFVAAQRNAEEALLIFDRLEDVKNKSDAYRVLGIVYRAIGRKTLAEARLTAAVDLARSSGALLEQAEAARELALLYCDLGRNRDALKLLNSAHQLFHQLDARTDMVDVASRVETLEGTFMTVVLEWGQSIESSDSYTHGHCERVAEYAVALGRELGLGDDELTTIRLGAYLHDLGKVKVPHEILNKPGRLTDEEFDTMKRHPVDGVEMLDGIEFPWDILPIVRWHHEKYDGTGYPDGLRGEEIPLNAQLICIVDVFDALTTTRSYRSAMPREKALAIVSESRRWWREDVFEAFLRTMSPDSTPASTPVDL